MINKYGVASSELTPLDCYTNHSSYLHSKLEQVELGNIKFIDFYRFLEAEDVEVLETFFDDFGPDKKPLHYLAKSLEYLAEADIAYFAPGWENARGCRIEHQCAVEYGIDIIDKVD
jgi:hypothetical protein